MRRYRVYQQGLTDRLVTRFRDEVSELILGYSPTSTRGYSGLLDPSRWARKSSNITDFVPRISASQDSSKAEPAPPAEKSSSICLSQALASCSVSQATSEILSPSGRSAIACLMASSVMCLGYRLSSGIASAPGIRIEPHSATRWSVSKKSGKEISTQELFLMTVVPSATKPAMAKAMAM